MSLCFNAEHTEAIFVVVESDALDDAISSVTGLRSGIAAFIGDSSSHGRSALRDPSGGRFCRDSADGRAQVGSGVSEVQAAFLASIAGDEGVFG